MRREPGQGALRTAIRFPHGGGAHPDHDLHKDALPTWATSHLPHGGTRRHADNCMNSWPRTSRA
eukprot:12935715-Prorocentrum_lima.AAC.1